MERETALKLLKLIIVLWRFDTMVKQTMNIAKGIGMGMLAGAAVAAIGSKAMGKTQKTVKSMKKSAGKAIHTVGDLIGDVERILK